MQELRFGAPEAIVGNAPGEFKIRKGIEVMKKVLVTGATGFTGGYLCRRLVSKGYEVRGLSLPGMNTDALEKEGVQIVWGDLTRKETLTEAVLGVDEIYHIAAVYREENVPKKIFWAVNCEGTKNLLELAKNVFIFGSSSSVYGTNKKIPFSEDDPIKNTISPYA